MNSKEIQYYHFKSAFNLRSQDQYTAVCYVPTNDELRALVVCATMGMPGEILLRVGSTKLHKKDQYCYKIGREKALQNAFPRSFKIDSMYFDEDGKIMYELRSDTCKLIIETKPERKTPYLLGATFW